MRRTLAIFAAAFIADRREEGALPGRRFEMADQHEGNQNDQKL
jgi:hypothetical protein